MDPRVAGFEWDEANRDKCGKHKAIGKTDWGRSILIVFTLRQRGGETLIRPISARHMHAREIAYYEKEAAQFEKR